MRSDDYLQGWRQRAQGEAQADAAFREQAWGRLRAVVAMLVREFGVYGVVVFGSLARGVARPGSDVDLLVEGLDPSLWLEATTRADALMAGTPVDLVPAERARPAVLERALAEGRRLVPSEVGDGAA